MEFNGLVNHSLRFFKRNSPTILTGIGIAGLIGSIVFAVKSTPKALIAIEDEKRRRNRELLDEAKQNGHDNCPQINRLPPIDIVKLTWRYYIPTACLGAASISCIVGGNVIGAKRNAMLTAACSLSSKSLKEYKSKVTEVLGEQKEKKIRDSVAKDRVDEDPVTNREIILTGKGNTLCYDMTFGRYFMSDMDELKKAMISVNRMIVRDMYASLNDFYDEINLPHGEMGSYLGWNINDHDVDLEFSSQLTDDGKPCLVVEYSVWPKPDFDNFA